MAIKDGEFAFVETPTGAMRTFIFRPAEPGRYSGVVLFSEIFQVTASIRHMAATLAGQGCVVAATRSVTNLSPPESRLPTTKQRSGNELKITTELTAYDSDARAELAFLKPYHHCTGRPGLLGIYLGGHWREPMTVDG